jgi:hypothetical protein
MYFSRNAGYSGQSYAHPVGGQNNGGGYYGGGARPTKPVIPPLFSTTAAGKLKVEKIPKHCMQMFLARVCLGTEYDVRNQQQQQAVGRPAASLHYFQGRPPLRAFHCHSCNKHVDLEKQNLDTLKASLLQNCSTTAAASTSVEIEIEEEEEETPSASAPVVPAAKPSRRGRAPKRVPLRKSRGTRASTAAAAAVITAPAPAPGIVAPVAAAPQTATPPAALQLSIAAPQSGLAGSTATASAPSSSSTTLAVPPVAGVLSAPASAAPASVAAAAAAPTSMDLSCTEQFDDGDDHKESDPIEAASAVDPQAAAVAVASAAAAPPSFDSIPVCCPHCRTTLGTRGSLLARPYRFDSVTSDHMSVVYDSAAAYPEFLVTYMHDRYGQQ